MRIDANLIYQARTARGGFLGEVIRILTGTNRPKQGWPAQIIGIEIEDSQWERIGKLNEKHNKNQAKKGKFPLVKLDIPCWHKEKPKRLQKSARDYKPNDGSQSDWALNTPEGCAWWSQPSNSNECPFDLT
jgi:hypothetical protein